MNLTNPKTWRIPSDKFGTPQPLARLSHCGAYHIAKAFVMGEAKYTLWHHTAIIGTYPDFQTACHHAQAHENETLSTGATQAK